MSDRPFCVLWGGIFLGAAFAFAEDGIPKDCDSPGIQWMQRAESNGNSIYTNMGSGDKGAQIWPVLAKNAVLVTDGRKIDAAELARPSSKLGWGDIKNSDAVHACESKGLHLPTRAEYETLSKCFGSRVALNKKFPDMDNRFFWTSSVDVAVANGAFLFDGSSGKLGVNNGGNRGMQCAVRCVSRPDPKK